MHSIFPTQVTRQTSSLRSMRDQNVARKSCCGWNAILGIILFAVWLLHLETSLIRKTTTTSTTTNCSELILPLSSSCLLRSYDILCLLYSNQENGNVVLDHEQYPSCRSDPIQFFRDSYTRNFQPSPTHLQARHMLSNLTALNLGSRNLRTCDHIKNRKLPNPNITLCTDRDSLDLFDYHAFISIMQERSTGVSNVLSKHVLEHFMAQQVLYIASSVFTILQPGGVWRIAVPDGYKPSWGYQDYIRPGGTPSGQGQRHMNSWNIDTLTEILKHAGFDVVPREYFDSAGRFHTDPKAYDNEDEYGRIDRSSKRDHRNKMPLENVTRDYPILMKGLRPNEPVYTSLWVDAIKPSTCQETILDFLKIL